MARILPFSIGKPTAEALFTEHLDSLYGVALRLTGQPADTEDLLQDLVLKLLQRPNSLTSAANPRAFLIRSLHNLFIDQWRSHRNDPLSGPQDADEYDIPEATSSDPRHGLDQQEWQEHLQQLLLTLPPDRRAVLVLHDIQGHSLPELEKILTVPIGTLKSRLHRARVALREALGEAWHPA